jgi:uncharacterized membrane protein
MALTAIVLARAATYVPRLAGIVTCRFSQHQVNHREGMRADLEQGATVAAAG